MDEIEKLLKELVKHHLDPNHVILSIDDLKQLVELVENEQVDRCALTTSRIVNTSRVSETIDWEEL